MKRILLSLLLLVGGVTSSVAGINTNSHGVDAAPLTTTITLTADERVIFEPEGTSVFIESVPVAAQFRGFTCSTSLTAQNRSIHPNNDIVLSSGSSATRFNSIERQSGELTVPGGSIVLGSSVVATLVMGSDGAYSSEFVVTMNCVEDEIQVCRDGQVITIGLSERRATDTDAPCPEPQIEVCRDGAIVTIFESERLATDTMPPCPVTTVEVCRDGVIVTVNEDDVLDTDTEAPCPVEQIEVCRNGVIVTIASDERRDTDLEAPCPVDQKQVCRDGVIVTVATDAVLDTDTDAPCPTPKKIEVCRNNTKVVINAGERRATDTDVSAAGTCFTPQVRSTTTPTALPSTGAGSLLALTSLTGIGGAIAHNIRMRRK